MSDTYLTDMGFIPETFKNYVDGEVYKKSSFLASPAVVDAQVDLAPIYGSTVTLPAWNALSGEDDVASASAPTINALSSSFQVAPILNRRKVYGVNDLVTYFSGSDPFRNIGTKFGEFWAQKMDEVLVASCLGAAAGIDALAAGSVINDISGGTGAAAVISANSLIDTEALMGEYMNDLAMLVVHPSVLAVLRKQNLILPQALSTSDGTKVFNYYGDLLVVTSNTAGMSAGGGVYNSIVVAKGAFGHADGTNPAHLLEHFREIAAGDQFASSRRYVLHPMGAKFTGTPAGATATNAELATAGNWSLGVASNVGFKARVLKSKIA